ncbi:MAG: beta-ketoacyl-ACP synthase III [Eubacteriales bacterium]|nr:beta-ketoacyl-ACP synthase III [Eubacteriales bacterium]
MRTRIIGTGSCLPEKILTNDELSRMVDTSDEWIKTRTGIENRRIAKEETTYSMGAEAAKEALLQSKTAAEDIDLIIAATSSAEYAFPNTASLIQKEIGADGAACFDVSVACSGFIVALNIADAMIKAGGVKKALVIGTEIMSGQLDWSDRSVCVLFGDGAGAVVLDGNCQHDKGQECNSGKANASGIIDADIHSDGSRGLVLTCGKDTPVNMNGQEVFKFAVKKVPESIQTVLKRNNLTADDIDCYILHQANLRIIESVAKRLKLDIEKFPHNMDKYGNTSAASIPILLAELNREHRIKSGDLLVLSGFGAGLSWGSLLVRL